MINYDELDRRNVDIHLIQYIDITSLYTNTSLDQRNVNIHSIQYVDTTSTSVYTSTSLQMFEVLIRECEAQS